MKTSVTLLTTLLYTLLAHAITVSISVYTVSRADVSRSINTYVGVFGATPHHSEKSTKYAIETPLTNNNEICVDLRKNIGPNPAIDPQDIMIAFSLWYTAEINDRAYQRYDEPIAVAFWKQPPKWQRVWFLVLDKLRRLSDRDLSMDYCIGSPDLLLTFYPDHEKAVAGEAEFDDNFVMLPSDRDWLKDYRHFLFIGATDQDVRYKAWKKSVKKQLTAKPFLDWVYW